MNIKHLKLAAHFAAQGKDIRYYLNGVLVEPGRLIASDGHRLCEVKLETGVQEKVIVPIDDVRVFLKRFTKKEAHLPFEVIKNGDEWRLQCGPIIQVFEPIDGRFPDVDRLIDRNVALLPLENQFNWSYLANAEAALTEFHGKKPGEFIAVVYTPLGEKNRQQGVIWNNSEGYHIIIMPRRIDQLTS